MPTGHIGIGGGTLATDGYIRLPANSENSVFTVIGQKDPLTSGDNKIIETGYFGGTVSYLFLGGDLDKNVEKIVNDLGMKDAYEKIKHEVLNPKEKEIIEKSKI